MTGALEIARSYREPSLYDAARTALADATRVDEVKMIIDKAAALEEYYRRSKDTQMIGDATRLLISTPKDAGATYAEQEKAKGTRGGRPVLGGKKVAAA